MKRIPVTIPLNHDGSFNDVLQDFINTMQIVTGDQVDIECSLKGELTVYFGDNEHLIKNKHPQIDIEVLYRGDYLKSIPMNESNPDKV